MATVTETIKIKELVFNQVRLYDTTYKDLTFDQLSSLFFQNSTTMRLTFTGFTVLRKIFTVYSFDLPANILTKHRMAFSTFAYPYYYTARRLMLFSSTDAVSIHLAGSIETYLNILHDNKDFI